MKNMQRIKPENLIVLMFVAEIGIPLYCHFTIGHGQIAQLLSGPRLQ
jgi:hypothetical protein